MNTIQLIILTMICVVSKFSLCQNYWMDTNYHDNGIISSYGTINPVDSNWTRYKFYENGDLMKVSHYLNDTVTPTGQETVYNTGGNIHHFVTFNKWNIEGPLNIFYPNGLIKLKGCYFNGFKTGRWIEYDSLGHEIAVTEYRLSKNDSICQNYSGKLNVILELSYPDNNYYYLDRKNEKVMVEPDSIVEKYLLVYEPKKKIIVK